MELRGGATHHLEVVPEDDPIEGLSSIPAALDPQGVYG
jgi:hypothetical protein